MAEINQEYSDVLIADYCLLYSEHMHSSPATKTTVKPADSVLSDYAVVIATAVDGYWMSCYASYSADANTTPLSSR